MYRSYTQIFRIFGAMIIFLQIPKVTALFKIRKYHNSLFSLSLSLTAGPHMSSLSSGFERGLDGADRRELVAGEPNSDGHSTKTFTTTKRIDLWHYGG